MAADPRIVHFGADGCNRIAVLRMAGYQIRDCDSAPGLLIALQDGKDPDALIVTEELGDPGKEVVRIARDHSAAPIVLFQSADCRCNESQYDLVIPVLSPPRLWLDQIAALIERSRAIRAGSKLLMEESERLRFESSAARERCVQLRRESRERRESSGRTDPNNDLK